MHSARRTASGLPQGPGPAEPAAAAGPPDPGLAARTPPAEVRVRPARADEAAQILAFWRRAAEGVSISDDEDGVLRLITRDPQALLLAESEGELAGTVIAGFDGWRCHLYRLAAAPELRRRGVSSALLAAAEERFAALGGRRGDAMVLDRNEGAHRAWHSAGYRREPQWSRWVKPL